MTAPAPAKARVLVADDQPDIIAALRLALKTAGFEASSAASIEEITRQVESSQFDLLLMDLNYARDTTSGAEGLALIGEMHGRHPHLPIVAMTGWANVDTAVEAMRRGARGYVPKPWDNDALLEIVRREIDEGRARASRGCPCDARVDRGAGHPAGACCRVRCPRWPASTWRRAGSRRRPSAATTTT